MSNNEHHQQHYFCMMLTTPNNKSYNVAVIGGGITGVSAVQKLTSTPLSSSSVNLTVHLFDQGQRGVGGRSSSRAHDGGTMRWDHGCQFFRADTETFKPVVEDWIEKGIVREYKGKFVASSGGGGGGVCERDFFGMPDLGPFYIGVDGMQSVPGRVVDNIINKSQEVCCFSLYSGVRVAQMERNDETKKWRLYGASGSAAFHDTPEKDVKQSSNSDSLGDQDGYDAVILTDVSSSFGKWHRASAGVPEEFAARVRDRVGARVPLFAVMIAFEKDSGIPFDTATFNSDVLWFASKSNSKFEPGSNKGLGHECWTLISTPEYAMKKIEETQMQDPVTGEYIPQSSDYLTTVPGPELRDAFVNELGADNGILGNKPLSNLPAVTYLNAQRWGSAMPSHRFVDQFSEHRKVIAGVPYDSSRAPLAPTKVEQCSHSDTDSFIFDDAMMLFQAGDMMSTYTPGFEGAAISGMHAADHLLKKLSSIA